jgi:hypothetical protein
MALNDFKDVIKSMDLTEIGRSYRNVFFRQKSEILFTSKIQNTFFIFFVKLLRFFVTFFESTCLFEKKI